MTGLRTLPQPGRLTSRSQPTGQTDSEQLITDLVQDEAMAISPRGRLTPGSAAKCLHLVKDPARKSQLRSSILVAQQKYWREWVRFRCSPAGRGLPNFDDVIRLLPIRRDFARFVELRPATMVIDLMAGSANMLDDLLQTGNLLAYTAIDSNESVKQMALRKLATVPTLPSRFVLHDLSEGLPEAELEPGVAASHPEYLEYISMWGITYLDADALVSLIAQCLHLMNRFRSTLSFCMLTNGGFDPQVLRQRFLREILPRAFAEHRWASVSRALMAIPEMMKFGATIGLNSPIWYPDEIVSLLQSRRLKVIKVDDRLLWGQCIAMKVSDS
jgi:hypothetical protein